MQVIEHAHEPKLRRIRPPQNHRKGGHRRTRRKTSPLTRDLKLITIFTVLAVFTGSMVSTHLVIAPGPAVAAINQTIPVGPDGRLSIQFAGDTMLADSSMEVINQHGYDWPFAGVAPALDSGDLNRQS